MADKTSLSAPNLDSGRPFEYLVPVAQLLIKRGNSLSYPDQQQPNSGFMPSQGGWICYLDKQLEFDLISSAFDLPAQVGFVSEEGAIFDERTWTTIQGPKQE